jgi:hypothetical protein
MANLENISVLINDLQQDIKAEVIVTNLLDAGIDMESIAAVNKGQFKRNYSKDILSAEVIKLNDYRKVLALNLSRDSFYDSMPEGLFHVTSGKPIDSGKEMAFESRQLRKDEEFCRKFFNPIEQEIFFHRVLLEQEERRLINKISARRYQDIFQAFWKIEPGLPQELVSYQILLLPFAHRITGDYSLTAACLSALLEETVSYRTFSTEKNFKIEPNNHQVSNNSLGNCSLGGDLISGNDYQEICPAIEFIIGPLKNSKIDEYIGYGERVTFLACFFAYFIPIGLECSFKIDKPVVFHFTLAEGEAAPVMGYDTVV